MAASRQTLRYRATTALALLGLVLLISWLVDANGTNIALSSVLVLAWVMLVFRIRRDSSPLIDPPGGPADEH